jgi:NAD(P)-dependent dehydrogenase (short-subunit alcohol dehydrogenase family)
MPRELANTVAIVTGGSSGIGLATARALVSHGARVVVADVQEPLDADLPADYIATDVRDPQAWHALVSDTEQRYGGIDLAHLNAGVALFEPDLTNVTDDQYQRAMAINVDGVFYGVRALIGPMRRRGGGAIVATSSLGGLIAFAPDPVYTAAKAAVIGFVRALAPTLIADRISIDAVCPAVTDTPIVPADVRREVQRVGLPMVAPEDIAAAVIACFRDPDQTGAVYVCQHGRPPIPYAFRGVPGPAGGERPPSIMGDPAHTL